MKKHDGEWKRRPAPAAVALVAATILVSVGSTAAAQESGQRAIELETIEVESEVPRRVAQFFVKRDQLQYEEMDEKPSFMPELLESVEKEPF